MDTVTIGGATFARGYCERLQVMSLRTLARAYYDERSTKQRQDINLGKEWLARSVGKKAAIVAYMFDRKHPVNGETIPEPIINPDVEIDAAALPTGEPVVKTAEKRVCDMCGDKITGPIFGIQAAQGNRHFCCEDHRDEHQREYQIVDTDIAVARTPEPASDGPADDALWALIAQRIQPLIKAAVDTSEIEALIEELRAESAKRTVCEIAVKRPNGTIKDVGRQHYIFPLAHAIAVSRVPLYIVGPAGSGKSYLAEALAEAEGVECSAISCSKTMSIGSFVGYMLADGYVRTAYRERYENGGVMLIDEIDSANPNAGVVLNAGLAGDYQDFPDGRVKKHPDFIPIAAANTIGLGADRQYVGRNQLDAATLDRFAFIEMGYDGGLTRAICGVKGGENLKPLDCLERNGHTPDVAAYFDFCDKVSAAIEELRERAICGPRARIYGAKLLAAGVKEGFVKEALIWAKMSGSLASKIHEAM